MGGGGSNLSSELLELQIGGAEEQEWQFRGLGRILKVRAERLDFTLLWRSTTEGPESGEESG